MYRDGKVTHSQMNIGTLKVLFILHRKMTTRCNLSVETKENGMLYPVVVKRHRFVWEE